MHKNDFYWCSIGHMKVILAETFHGHYKLYLCVVIWHWMITAKNHHPHFKTLSIVTLPLFLLFLPWLQLLPFHETHLENYFKFSAGVCAISVNAWTIILCTLDMYQSSNKTQPLTKTQPQHNFSCDVITFKTIHINGRIHTLTPKMMSRNKHYFHQNDVVFKEERKGFKENAFLWNILLGTKNMIKNQQ